ncbi:MAG: hypothetical protein ACJ8AD_16040 [Gemmatimonadaceae bacterium]
MRRLAALAIGFAIATSSSGLAAYERRANRLSAASLVVQVLDVGTRRPLPNADVFDLASGAHRLTNVSGETRFEWPATGVLRLRVRQLGYRFVERELRASGAAVDTVTVALDRVAFVLPEMRAEARHQCDVLSDSSSRQLALLALGQLRLAAEHYEQFRREYPFDMRGERRTVLVGSDGRPKQVRVNTERESSDRWGDPYHPGDVLRRERRGFSASLLFISTLADSVFWDGHCFSVAGMETRGTRRLLRLDFAPVPDLRTPDWEGTAWIDSATSALHRIEFKLAGLTGDDEPRRLEGYTTFSAPSPYITIPDSIVAYWWRRASAERPEWGNPDVVQLLRVVNIDYRGATPPP